MATVQAIINLPYSSGLPRDVAQYTFAFVTPDLDESTLDIVRDRLQAWLNVDIGPGTPAISRYLSTVINRSACFLEIFDISSLPSGPPIYRANLTLQVASSASNLPLEVALVTSFQGEKTISMPQARRRGRVFVGPFNANALSAAAGDPLPNTLLVNTLSAVCDRMAELSDEDGIIWCVWSRAEDLLVPITNGWTNNEWDTQRRRQKGEISRRLWALGA